jgi:8-oxo-dGTP pyrophosphatase MutT (NUDIX family)
VFRHLSSSAFTHVEELFAGIKEPLYVLLNIEPATPAFGYGTRDVCMPGGRVEKGEGTREAARREVKEETGLDAGQETVLYCIQCCGTQQEGPCHCAPVTWEPARVNRRACNVSVFVAAARDFLPHEEEATAAAAAAADTTDGQESDESADLSEALQRMHVHAQEGGGSHQTRHQPSAAAAVDSGNAPAAAAAFQA